ncbi:MAG: VWA domain-containing protein [Gemmatimonadota bacterium]
MSLSIRTDRRLIRADARSDRYVLARVTAPLSTRSRERTPVNVALVLDRSGSMGGSKIELARKAVRQALQGLDERDRFALVVYDDRIDVVVESTHASAEAKRNALERLDAIDARGSTNLAEGWLRGAEQVALHQSEQTVGRCLLLTDGLANVGITDVAELERHAGELRRRGVMTSTFGIGADFDEALLQAMSVAGGGHFYFIETALQIPDFVVSELEEVLDTVARDVVLELRTPEGASIEPLSIVTKEGHGNSTRVILGDLVSGQELDVVLRLSFPSGEVGRRLVAVCSVVDREGVLDRTPQSVSWEYADPAADAAQPRDRAVDRHVAALHAARAKQEAVRLNRIGDVGRASEAIAEVTRHIRDYAGDDPELNQLLVELESDRGNFAMMMEPLALKQQYFASSVVGRMRDPKGKARRRQKGR